MGTEYCISICGVETQSVILHSFSTAENIGKFVLRCVANGLFYF